MKNLLKISALILFVISCTQNTNSLKNDYSNYYRDISKADSLFFLKEYKKVITLLDQTFKEAEPINTFRFNEYCYYLLSKHYTNQKINKSEIENLISKYGLTKESILKYPILDDYLKKHINNREYDSLKEFYKNSINLDLRNRISSMVEEDQYYRTEYEGSDYKVKMREVGLKHESFLINMFDQNIYPGKKEIGNMFYIDDYADIEVLLLHTRDSIRLNYFLPKLRGFIKQGKTNPYIYGMLLDQYELYNDRPQKYGTYNVYKITSEDMKIYAANRKKLDIGFPSIELDVWRDGLSSK